MIPRHYPLTCGQTAAWMNFDGVEPRRLFMMRDWAFPPSIPLSVVSAAVHHVLDRHEMLRSTLTTGADGTLRVTVHPMTEQRIVREDLVLGPDEVNAFGEAMFGDPFDLSRQWPSRWTAGRLTTGEGLLIFIVHHFAAGAGACEVVKQEIGTVVGNLHAGRAPGHGLSPPLTRREVLSAATSPAGVKRDEKHREYLRSVLESLPSKAFLAEVGAPGPEETAEQFRTRRRCVTLRSAAFLRCVDELSHLWSLPPSIVIFATLSLAVGDVLGRPDALVWRLFNDGVSTGRPRTAAVCYEPAQTLVPATGLPGGDLREASSRMFTNVVKALRLGARGDCALLEETHHVEVPFFFNFIEQSEGRRRAEDDVGAAWAELAPRDDVSAEELVDHAEGSDFMAFVWRDAREVRLSLYAHARLSTADMLRQVLERCKDLVYRHAVPRAAALDDLLEILRDAGGVPDPDPAADYLAAGGRIHHIPAVLIALRRRGWEGLSPHHFSSQRSLNTLSRLLRQQAITKGTSDMSVVKPGDLYHLGIVVEDLDTAIHDLAVSTGARWTSPIEFEQWIRFGGSDKLITFMAAYSLDAPHFELIRAEPDSPFQVAGPLGTVHHLGYWAQDFAEDSKRLEDLGLTPEVVGLDEHHQPWGFAYFRAPSGALIEIADRGAFPPSWTEFLAEHTPPAPLG